MSDRTLDPALQARVDAVLAAFEDEAKNWDVLPGYASGNRDRLLSLIRVGAPEIIIDKDIALLWKKIKLMQEGHERHPGMPANSNEPTKN